MPLTQEELQKKCEECAELVRRELSPDIGLALQLVCLGGDGCISYASDLDRVLVYETWEQIRKQNGT